MVGNQRSQKDTMEFRELEADRLKDMDMSIYYVVHVINILHMHASSHLYL